MPQRKMRKLVTATIAVGLIGGLAFGSPLAFARSRTGSGPVRSAARPGSGRRGARARGSDRPGRRDSAGTAATGAREVAAPGRSAGRAAAPAPDPLAPPVDPLARRPPGRTAGGPVRRAADDHSRRHPGGPEPDAVHRRTGVPAAVLQPGQRLHGRRGQADHHQFPAADRRPPDGRAGDPHLVEPAGAGQVLLDERHPGALAPDRLLAGQHDRPHRRERRQVELPHR